MHNERKRKSGRNQDRSAHFASVILHTVEPMPTINIIYYTRYDRKNQVR